MSSELKSIYDKNHTAGRITVFESPDKSRAFMRIEPRPEDFCLDSEDILYIISTIGITTGINESSIEKALSSIASGEQPDLFVIAEASPPVPGTDGAFEMHYDENSPYVEKNQLIVRLSEPVPGEHGKDVYGNTIEPYHGKMPLIQPGDHVIEKERYEFYSEIFGRVCFQNNTLSVQRILDISVSDDRMEAALTYHGTHELTREMIAEELSAKNIVSGIDNHAIDYIVSAFNDKKEPIENFVIARGTPSQEGRDGELKYLFEMHEGPLYKENKDGSIDIRETNIVHSVEEGTEIAYIIPHIDPVPGKDIYGKLIPARKVARVSLNAGKNTKVSSDGLHFYAEVSGRPLVESDMVGPRISVNEVFYVEGDLDLSVGNIDFNGIVEIGGDVEDGFKIKSTKTVIINGIVGACSIEAGLDIEVHGGCNGKEQAKLLCGGQLKARYINEASVRARGDIVIQNEIINSHIETLGRVIVQEKGSIRGGQICAKRGIVSYDIGSDMGVKTVLVPGHDFELREHCKEIESTIIEANNEFIEINKRIAPLLKNKELLPKLPREQREKIKETIEYMQQLKKRKSACNEQKEDLISKALQDAVPEVIVYHHIYQGVLLKIGDSRREISSMLEGPLRLYEENETVTVEPYSQKTSAKKKKAATASPKSKPSEAGSDTPATAAPKEPAEQNVKTPGEHDNGEKGFSEF